jgi:hypothetical protein
VNSLNGKLYPDPTERGATASDGTWNTALISWKISVFMSKCTQLFS